MKIIYKFTISPEGNQQISSNLKMCTLKNRKKMSPIKMFKITIQLQVKYMQLHYSPFNYVDLIHILVLASYLAEIIKLQTIIIT